MLWLIVGLFVVGHYFYDKEANSLELWIGGALILAGFIQSADMLHELLKRG